MKKRGFLWLLCVSLVLSCLSPVSVLAEGTPTFSYCAHVQSYGWQNPVTDGEMAGTTGQAKRLEALELSVNGAEDGGIRYQAHVQTYGWQDWVTAGQIAGTTGQAKRMEAIKIELTGALAEQYDVYYRVHVQTYGWQDWVRNGAVAGTTGQAKRLEALEIILQKKQPEPSAEEWPTLRYQVHGQTYGWQNWVTAGTVAGTTGQAKRLEGFRIEAASALLDGGIRYRAHVQKVGWQDWVYDGALAGTTGEAKRLEAVKIELTGTLAKRFDIYYRGHVQRMGWSGWAKNGEACGSEGMALRMEALEIRLTPKFAGAPGSTDNCFWSSSSGVSSTAEQKIYGYVQAVYASQGRDLKSCFDWVADVITYKRRSGHITPPEGYSRREAYALEAFETHQGNCYTYAAAFYYLAKYLGYNAEYVEGQVPRRSGGYAPHGWVEIDGAYICDPEAQAEINPNLNFYMQPIGNALLRYVR